ncbi:hypothetical protein MCP1_240035 [Candidatus Terasakiella magnetica]|nr:hypothetical protein MCP1_240035 [Candidatus Terasakiella magnetica]
MFPRQQIDGWVPVINAANTTEFRGKLGRGAISVHATATIIPKGSTFHFTLPTAVT